MDHSNTRLSSQLDRNPGMSVVLLLVLLNRPHCPLLSDDVSALECLKFSSGSSFVTCLNYNSFVIGYQYDFGAFQLCIIDINLNMFP